jgi:serine/threonine-protein kinase
MAARDAHIAELFNQLLEGPPRDRARMISASTHNDPALAADLESLLDAHDSADLFFDELSRQVLSPAMNAVGLGDPDGTPNLLERLNEAVGADYAIEREIGGGGMSRVFTATEIRLGRKVVIKTLPQALPLEVSVERFRREIQLAAGLQNSHIVPVLTTGAADRVLYYVMPYVEGETLRARLSRVGALPVDEAISIWRDVLDALGAAHQAGIVHRDIKPENILLSGRNALVADFGIARAIEASTAGVDTPTPGIMLGTPAYMAPEQTLTESSGDQRIDIYAAGLVMYEMLAAHSPFSGMSVGETITAQRTLIPPHLPRDDVPPSIASLIKKCIEKDPAARPDSVESLLEELNRALNRQVFAAKRRLVPIAIVILLAVSVAAAGAFALLDKSSSAHNTSRIADGSAVQPSLLVLPLANLSRDSADAPLSDGMTAELIGSLSAKSNLRVISGAALVAGKGTRKNPRAIADSIGVSSILEGSMQQTGSRLRLQLRLVNVRDGSTRWAENFDRDMRNVFALQDEISDRVSTVLGARAPGSRKAVTADRYTPNVAAYELYLRGMDISLLRGAAERREAVAYLKKAIAADSGFAAAYAGLARTYMSIGNPEPDRRKWFARAESAAVKAVSLDDSLGEAHAALGWVMLATGRMSRAEPELKTALALNPAVPRLHEFLARLYMEMGRSSDQLAEARAGLASDPLSYSAIQEMALALNMNKRCDESLRILAPLKSLKPPAAVAGIISGQCYAYKKMWPQAIAEFQWTISNTQSGAAPALLGYALARGGRRDEARKVLAELLANRTFSRGGIGVGIVYAGLGDYDRAFEWIEKGIKEGQSNQYLRDPMFEDLQRDPRFGRLDFYAGFQNR